MSWAQATKKAHVPSSVLKMHLHRLLKGNVRNSLYEGTSSNKNKGNFL